MPHSGREWSGFDVRRGPSVSASYGAASGKQGRKEAAEYDEMKL